MDTIKNNNIYEFNLNFRKPISIPILKYENIGEI